MRTAFGRLRASLLKLVTPLIGAVGLLTLATSGASAVVIDFSMASLDGSNGFTVTGYQLTNGNCPGNPGDPPCTSIPNEPNVVQITANSGTFDLLEFMYDFQGQTGNLLVSSNLSADPLGIISILNTGNLEGTYTVMGSLLAYFTDVTWIKFFTDTQANVRIDSVTVAAVPVPAGVALGAGALGALGLLGWRKNRKHKLSMA